MKALLVDDDPDIRNLLSLIIKEFNIPFDSCENGAEAWQLFQQNQYDLILADWIMPKMDGLALCRHIRAHPHGDNCIIVIITSEKQHSDLMQVLAAGADDYLSKPFKPEAFKVRLQIALNSYHNLLAKKASEKQLINAKQEAEAANLAKTEFLASVTHELRTPLNAIVGFTDLLTEMTSLEEEQLNYAANINKSSESLLTLIEDLMDFSKVDTGNFSLINIPFDMEMSVTEVTDMLVIDAEKKGLELICRYTPQAETKFIGDPKRIRQIMTN
ncbi:MAG: response regulator, partial [Gammaproteobacteria bacterium]|nr:response regulator [Gammaproteobacteria bacterium]